MWCLAVSSRFPVELPDSFSFNFVSEGTEFGHYACKRNNLRYSSDDRSNAPSPVSVASRLFLWFATWLTGKNWIGIGLIFAICVNISGPYLCNHDFTTKNDGLHTVAIKKVF